MRSPRILALGLSVLALAALAPATGAARRAPTATADWFTQATPALRSGQIEILTRSTPPDTVTGGDVLVSVRGLGEGDRLAVRRNGRSVTSVFGRVRDGERSGLVTGLREGSNRITAIVRGPRGRRVATLGVRNHPVTGPVISGPHQRPFYCETRQSGLGEPIDEHCSIAPRVDWFYRSTTSNEYRPLPDPTAPYPSDVARTRTRSGRTVPFVVRLETRTINRGITRIATLDDPHARGRDPERTPSNWSRRVTYLFGESCGVGYHQGRSNHKLVLGVGLQDFGGDVAFAVVGGLDGRVGRGDMVVHNTQSAYGVYCNPLVSAETLGMVKEHIIERYGDPDVFMSTGGSGGALQQYNALNNAPGLVDGALPIASFTDVLSTAMTVVDCGLLLNYWDKTATAWSDEEKLAVSGHRTNSICADWRDLFLDNLDPTEGCAGIVPRETRYDRERNPTGVRCTLQDATKHIWTKDPATGFANRPYDNVGVQYGLAALNAGQITPAQFVELNREVGGYDLDGRPVSSRSAMNEKDARTAYELGGVIGRGALHRTPVLDLATYIDLIPILDIHDHVRPFQVRERLRRRSGQDGSMRIWRGVSLPGDGYPEIDRWIDEIRRRGGEGDPRVVDQARPSSVEDRCMVGFGTNVEATGRVTGPFGIHVPLAPDAGSQALLDLPLRLSFPERAEVASPGVCAAVFPAGSEPRMVAGGPLSDDVLKCRLKPVDPADYRVDMGAAALEELRRIFPAGVCDWSKPGVGEVSRSMVWVSIGGRELRTPRSLRWRAARSAPVTRIKR